MSVSPLPIIRGRPKDVGKRRDILEAARVLFMQRGFHGTSMDALAKRANVSKATLYSHFEDKTALYQALIEDKMADYQLDDFAVRLTDDLETDLLYIARQLLDLIYSDDALDMVRMVIAEQREGSDMPHLFMDTGPRRVLGQIADYLQARMAAGVIARNRPQDDAALFAALIIGHTEFMGALTGVEVPMDAAARQARAATAVEQFMMLKKAD